MNLKGAIQAYEQLELSLGQGAKANWTGANFEDKMEDFLRFAGYEYETQVKYTNLYGSNRCKIDFVVVNSLGNPVHIECKFQNVSGSVDEKLPFCLHNLEQFDNGLVLLGGNHWKTERGVLIRTWADSAYVRGVFKSKVVLAEEFMKNASYFLDVMPDKSFALR